jgi:hypothetical protein
VVLFNVGTKAEISRVDLSVPIVGVIEFRAGVAAVGEDGVVRICRGGTVQQEFVAHPKRPAAIAALVEDTFLVTTGADRDIRVWNGLTGELLYTEQQIKEKFGEGGLAIAVAPPTHPAPMFAVASADGIVRVFGPK